MAIDIGEAVRIAWEKAAAIPGLDEALWRMAVCGQPVAWSAYRSDGDMGGWKVVRSQVVALAPLGSEEPSPAAEVMALTG